LYLVSSPIFQDYKTNSGVGCGR